MYVWVSVCVFRCVTYKKNKILDKFGIAIDIKA